VGDVHTSQALEHIRKAFDTGVRRSVPAIVLPAEPPQVGKRAAEKTMDIAQAHMALAFRTVLLTHPDLYPLDVLSYILSNGDSSRLVKRIKDEQQLVYAIQSSSYTPSYVPGSLTVWATLEPEQLEAAQQAILAELYRLRDEPVSPAELAKAKKQKIAEHVFGQQTAQQRARALGIDILSTHDPHFSDTYVKNIQRVTAAEIQRVARHYFREEQLNIAVVRPKRSAAQAAETSQNAQPRTAMVKKRLDNDMTLLLQRNPALPIVSMQAYFNAGVRVETPDTNGLTQLMARLLVKGTTSRSADDIATTFDAMGGELVSGSGNNSFFVMASSLAEEMPTALDIFADVIIHPAFPAEELEKMRRLMLAELERQNDNWQTEVSTLFRATHYTTSPYRLQPEGSPEALPKLTRQDVMEMHARYAVPNNTVLAIVGDIDVDRTAELVAHTFADFRQRPLLLPDVPTEPAHTTIRRKVKETTKQVAAIYVGFPGATLANVQDRYPLHILDAILSGIGFPGGWLHTELRGQQLVYVVHALNWLGLDPGYFGIIAATQPPKAQQVIDIILQKVEQAKAGKFSDDELERAKRLAVIATRLQRQSNKDIAADAAINELFRLGYNFSMDEAQRLDAVTRAEVQRVAQTYLNHPTIVLTTPTP
jgi:zinc protease